MTLIPASQIDRDAILKAFNINPRDPKAQALVLACEKYGLDPLLKHAVLISGNLYVTRDGLLHVAHQTDRLDGIVVEDESETADEWRAKVTVWVKGQTHGYTYTGRYPKSGQQKKYGPEMAIKVAEVMALRRAFGVTGIPTVEEQWDKSDALAAKPSASQIEAGGAPRGEPSGAVDTPASAPPPPPPDDDIVDAELVDDGDPLELLRAAMADVKPAWTEAKALRRAREVARTDLGLEKLPTDFESLPKFPKVLAALAQELAEAAA